MECGENVRGQFASVERLKLNQVHYADIGHIKGDPDLLMYEIQKVLKDGNIRIALYKYTLLPKKPETKVIDREDFIVTSSYHDSAKGDI